MRLVFMGTPEAAARSLARCLADGHEIAGVYTQPDRPSGRGQKVIASPVKQLACEHGLAVLQPTKLRTPEAVAEFAAHRADVAVVVAFGRILPAGFLNAFPRGAINVHFSLLPKYRGAAPVNWAIVNGEVESGVTTMQMDEGLDTGDILMQQSMTIEQDDTSVDLLEKLAGLGADLLSETLAKLSVLTAEPQDASGASLAPIMTKEDGLIDWSLPAGSIVNRIRGFQPFPSAHSLFRGEMVKFWRATPAETASQPGSPPGEMLNCAGGNIEIAAGGGTVVSVQELQPAGRRRMDARDFINGIKPQTGEIFGR